MFGFTGWPLLVLLMIGVVALLLLVAQWKRIKHRKLATCTVTFVMTAAAFIYWGNLHIAQLRRRAWSDYGFETEVWLLAATAFVLGCGWSFRERKLVALSFTIISGYFLGLFSLMLATY
jgi:hypothetical protein